MEQDKERLQETEAEIIKALEEETVPYEPRPRWQILCAWVALGIFVVLLVLYYINIARGGL